MAKRIMDNVVGYPSRATTAIADVVIQDRYREPDSDTIAELKESIYELGLINPILCYCQKGSPVKRVLIAGYHRYQAVKELEQEGRWPKHRIDTLLFDEEPPNDVLKLYEISENAFRTNATPDEKLTWAADALMLRTKLGLVASEPKELGVSMRQPAKDSRGQKKTAQQTESPFIAIANDYGVSRATASRKFSNWAKDTGQEFEGKKLTPSMIGKMDDQTVIDLLTDFKDWLGKPKSKKVVAEQTPLAYACEKVPVSIDDVNAHLAEWVEDQEVGFKGEALTLDTINKMTHETAKEQLGNFSVWLGYKRNKERSATTKQQTVQESLRQPTEEESAKDSTPDPKPEQQAEIEITSEAEDLACELELMARAASGLISDLSSMDDLEYDKLDPSGELLDVDLFKQKLENAIYSITFLDDELEELASMLPSRDDTALSP